MIIELESTTNNGEPYHLDAWINDYDELISVEMIVNGRHRKLNHKKLSNSNYNQIRQILNHISIISEY